MKKNRIPHNYANNKIGAPTVKLHTLSFREQLLAAAKVTGYDISKLPTSFSRETGDLEDGTHVMRICPDPNPLKAYVHITSDNGVFTDYAIRAGVESLLLTIVSGQAREKRFPANATP